MTTLKGNKVVLRAVEPSDSNIIFEWENNEQNWQLSNTLSPFSMHTIEQYIEIADRDIYENKQLRLMIDDLSSDKTIGSIDLFEFDPYHLRAGVGILINDISDRRKGFASESLELLIGYCKNHLALKQLFCSIGEKNKSSIQLFESKGFTRTGVKKQWQRISVDQWGDIYFYQLAL